MSGTVHAQVQNCLPCSLAAFTYCLLSVVIIHDDVRTISQLGKSLHNIRNRVQCPLFSIQKFCRVCFFITKVCSVRFFRLQKVVVCAFLLQKFVVCAFLDYKGFVVCAFLLQKFVVCAFQTSKVCRVRFFRLQKFVVRFFHYKACSVRFLRLPKFVEFDVSEQLTLAKQFFIIQSLYPSENQIILTNGKGQIVATGYGPENT